MSFLIFSPERTQWFGGFDQEQKPVGKEGGVLKFSDPYPVMRWGSYGEAKTYSTRAEAEEVSTQIPHLNVVLGRK